MSRLLHARPRPGPSFAETGVEVRNETTLDAGRRLLDEGLRPLALNFANGLHPGGGFRGARAQEEVLCRSSALFATLEGDLMYETHGKRHDRESSDWAILSPDVPVFRMDDGTALDEPWPLSVITCAAPVAENVGQPRAGDLLEARIHRVLAIATARGYETLVLGAWGCGAFGNDPVRTARDFRSALEDWCRIDILRKLPMATKTLTEKIEALSPEKKAEVEDFVDLLASRVADTDDPHARRPPGTRDDLLERIVEHREELRRKYGLFDSVPIIRECRSRNARICR